MDFYIQLTNYAANRIGIYNWEDIIVKKNKKFSHYISLKIQKKQIDLSGRRRRIFTANVAIKEYQLVSVNKFLISIEERKFTQNQNSTQSLLQNIQEFLILDQHFSNTVNQIFSEVGTKYKFKENKDPINVRVFNVFELSHCSRTIYPNNSIVFICPQIVHFKIDEERPNCTAICLNGSLFCFALRRIEKDECLTIRFLGRTMKKDHESLAPFYQTGKKGLQAYFAVKDKLQEEKKYMACYRYLWTNYKQENNKERVVDELLQLLQQIFDLELIVLLICHLRNDPNFPKRMEWMQLIFKAFQIYFKLDKEVAERIVASLGL